MIRFARSSSDEWPVIRPSHSYFLGYFWHINQFSYVFWPFLDHGTNKIWIFSPGSPRRPCFWTSWAVRQRMWFFSYSWFDGTVMDYTILIILYDFYMIISRLYIYICIYYTLYILIPDAWVSFISILRMGYHISPLVLHDFSIKPLVGHGCGLPQLPSLGLIFSQWGWNNLQTKAIIIYT